MVDTTYMHCGVDLSIKFSDGRHICSKFFHFIFHRTKILFHSAYRVSRTNELIVIFIDESLD